MMMATSSEAGWFSAICCLFCELNNLVFRVRVPVCVCVRVCVLMNNKAIIQ